MARNEQPVIYALTIGEEVTLTIRARERYSLQRIAMKAGEAYLIKCDENQRWYDLIIPSSPYGYRNFIAPLFGLRVKEAKCFCLCYALNENDSRASALSADSAHVFVASQEGTLSFFANDVWGYEWNNWGSIQVKVVRTI